MTSLAAPLFPLACSPLTELLSRQRTLARYGIGMLVLALVAVALQSLDPRTLESGVGIWVKPAKFFSSVGIFAVTMAWFFDLVRPERRASRSMRALVATIVIAGTFELAWICWQAANGLESHFNRDTLFFALMYALMGVFALLLLVTTLPLAWEIWFRPRQGTDQRYVFAVAVGLVLTFLLGGGFAAAIPAHGGHSVGAAGGAVPIFGWNRAGGDLRIAHFVGIHAQQAIPLLAIVTGALAERRRGLILAAGIATYVALAGALYAQARAGMALFPIGA